MITLLFQFHLAYSLVPIERVRGNLMVGAIIPGSSSLTSSQRQGHCVYSSARHFTLSACRHPSVYMDTGELNVGVPYDGVAS